MSLSEIMSHTAPTLRLVSISEFHFWNVIRKGLRVDLRP